MGSAIGDTAVRHGVPAHVLRHWEDAGAVVPGRTGAGHRVYDAEHDAQIELIKCGKVAGLSLDQIAVMLHGPVEARVPMLRRRRGELDRAVLEIEAAKRLLDHVLSCESPTGCPECAHPRASFMFPDESSS